MNWEELQKLPEGSYVVIEHGNGRFKYFIPQLTEEFWNFLLPIADITVKSNDKETEK